MIQEGVGHLRYGEERGSGGGEEVTGGAQGGAHGVEGKEGREGEGRGECCVIGWRQGQSHRVGEGGSWLVMMRRTGREAVGLLDGDGGGGDAARQEEGGLSQRLPGRKTESGDGGVGAGGGGHAVQSHCVQGQGWLGRAGLCLNDGSLYYSTHRVCCPAWPPPV